MSRVQEFYARHAERFDEARGRDLMERPYLEVVTNAVPAPASVLDLGCGAGEPLVRYFAERGYTVTGVDLVGAMVERCRQRFPEMTFLQADMRTLALARRFDIVLAWDSFFHLEHADQRAIFRTFADHNEPGGVLLFTSGTSRGESVGELFGDALYHASLDTDEYEALLHEHGYTVMLHRVDDPQCGGHTVWLARRD